MFTAGTNEAESSARGTAQKPLDYDSMGKEDLVTKLKQVGFVRDVSHAAAAAGVPI